MANVYWNKEGADAHWDTHAGNWWNNVLHRVGTDENGAVPIDTNYAYLLGITAPDNGPAVPVSLIGLDTSALTAAVTITGVVTVTGALVLGAPFGTDVHTFEGNGSGLANAIIQGASVVDSDSGVGTGAIFKDTASIKNAVGFLTSPRFYDSSGATGAKFATSIYCYGNQTFTEADTGLVFTGVEIYVFGSLTINNTGTNTITGVPNIHLMSRTADFRPIGDVTASVALYRFATAHRLRRIS